MSEATQVSRTSGEEIFPTVMTFLIKSQLPGRHPGIVEVQGQLGGSTHDVGGYKGIRLYEGTPGEQGAAYHIAEAIYAEETQMRQSHTLRDARFDFSSPCQMFFYQRRMDDLASSRREIASLILPGGQSREAVCQAIVRAILSGWQKPPEAAYIPPEQLTSGQGALIYGRDGERLAHFVTFDYNGTRLEAPLVFVAWCPGSMRFATMHPGSTVGPGSDTSRAPYYRYFTLLETDRGWLLCDGGAHDLDEPLAIAERGPAGSSWHYFFPQPGFPLAIRYDDQASRAPSDYSWGARKDEPVLDLLRRLDKAVTTCSLYCAECRRGWLWEADEQELRALATRGNVSALCDHCWLCGACGRWSTPTSRASRYEQFPCRHAQPPAPVARLVVQDWRMTKAWRAGRIRAPLPPFVRELPPPGEVEVDVMLAFHTCWPCAGNGAQVRPERWKTVDVPAGARLVGAWDHRQPHDGNAYRVVIDEEPWSIPSDLVSISCLTVKRATPSLQLEIAHGSLREAAAHEGKQGEEAALLQAYARAVIELALGGAPAADLAPARLRYGHLLVEDGRVALATQELERAVEEAKRAVEEFSTSYRDRARIGRELQAVDALMTLGRLYLQQAGAATLLQVTAKRLLVFESEVGRFPEHRANLIELRLTAAHLLASVGDTKEATRLQRQAAALLKGAPQHEQERHAAAVASLRAVLYPEDAMLARLREALASYRGETPEQVRELEGALLLGASRRSWSEQFYSIYLRANRPSQAKGAVDLQQDREGYGSQTLRGGAGLPVFELAQQEPMAAGRLLAGLLLSDLEVRNGKYPWDRAPDFGRELTFIFALSLGIGSAEGGRRAARYALFTYGECVLPGGTPQAERLARLSDVLELGVRLMAVALPDAPGAAQVSTPALGTGGHATVAESDVPLLWRIRRYGKDRPHAASFRDYAADLLAWVREHLPPADEGQGCQLWLGDSEARVGPLTLPLVPRELAWVLEHEEALPLHTQLWPLCGRTECVRPDHQLQIILATGAALELEARLGGKENARFAIEEGKRSGALSVKARAQEEEGFARADFALWQASSAFAERYLRGRGAADTAAAQTGQEGLKPRFEQLETKQRERIAALWGVQAASVSPKKLAMAWVLALNDRFAARFVWQALDPRERTVLFSVLGVQDETGVRRPDLLRTTGLAPEELDAILDHLESLLLVRIGYARHPNREDLWQMIDCAGFDWTLREVGEEFFSSEDRTRLTLSEHLTLLPSALISEVAERYGFALPRSSSEIAILRRTILEALLDQPARVFAELGRLDDRIQRLVALVYEHGGKVTASQAAAALETDLPSLCEQLRAARPLCLLHEAFAPGGERVIFVPGDLYAASQRHSAAPRTRRQLEDFFTPTYIRDGQPWLLYDLTVLLWFVYHSTIELTQDDGIPVRVAKKMAPYLHLLPREDADGRDWRVDLLDYLAWSWDLVKKSTLAGVKTHYLPGEWLERWARLDLVTQTRLALLWWLETQDWIDLIPEACREEEVTQAHAETRKGLVSALQTLEPGRWYAVGDLLNTLWEGHLAASRGSRLSSKQLSRDRWMRADGLNYTGMLASTLHELGIVALGYHQVPDRDLETRLSPDLVQVTGVGSAVLSSTLSGFPSGEPPSVSTEQRTLIVQPNFDLLFLVPDMRAVYRTLPFVGIRQIERTSRMRLTQDALHDGMGQGWDVDQVIATLSELSQQEELPQNVLYTLRDWASKHKSAQLSQVVLIEVPSEAIADAVCGMEPLRRLGVRKVAPLCLAVLDPARLLDVRQALLKEGVAVRMVTEKA